MRSLSFDKQLEEDKVIPRLNFDKESQSQRGAWPGG